MALESFDSMVQDKGRDYAERQFDKTLEVIDMAIDKLNFMSNTVNDESAKLVGIKLTKSFEMSIFTTIITVVAAGTQFYIQNIA